MIYFKLFLAFFQIGLFSFGGGYSMISIIREKCLANCWLTEDELMNFIAVSESTPGPIAVNMATFVGSSQGGLLGALCATLGVILPAFVIILIIASLVRNVMKYKGVNTVLKTVRPVVIGLIIGTGIMMLLNVIMNVSTVGDPVSVDWYSAIIFLTIVAVSLSYKRIAKRTPSPILLILISAIMGIILY